MSYTKSELKAREAVRLALSKLHSAEIRAWNIATTSRDYGPVRERWDELRRTSNLLVNGADRLRAAGDTGNQG